MKIFINKTARPVLLTMAVLAVVALVSCGIKTYNMIDPGKPSESFTAFYRAVSDGDDAAVNELLYNYTWTSLKPAGKNSNNEYVINGVTVSGSDAMVFDVMLHTRSCRVISESDYSEDGSKSSVTIVYTSFDLSKFQTSLTEKAVSEVKKKQRSGQNFSNPSETREIIERIKIELLNEPQKYFTSRKFKVDMICDKGKWKVVLSEDFYKALSGNIN